MRPVAVLRAQRHNRCSNGKNRAKLAKFVQQP
jgi:hypothetical protein